MAITKFTAALILSALGSASPLTSRYTQCIPSAEFTLHIEAPEHPYGALQTFPDSSGLTHLVFSSDANAQGTSACIVDGHLSFAIANGLEAAYVSPGNNPGHANPVNAIEGAGNATFSLVDGYLDIERTAALQSIYACNTIISGEQRLGLFFGVPNVDGSAPGGCVMAKVKAVSNLSGNPPKA